MSNYVLGIDQGTSSTRVYLYKCRNGKSVCSYSVVTTSIHTVEGYTEQDPIEIWESVETCINEIVKQVFTGRAEKSTRQIKAVGISNQRETTVCWNKNTGETYGNAILWLDNRNEQIVEDLIQQNDKNIFANSKNTGLPFSTYFSSTKIKWLLDTNEKFRHGVEQNEAIFGTIDTWLIWKFTNGKNHLTDVTNASRTSLFNIRTMKWDKELCDFFQVPMSILPKVLESYDDFGVIEVGPITGTKICAVFGDQSAALYGQDCFDEGMAKITYGTGAFLLCNIGTNLKYKENGTLYTLASKIDGVTKYAIEGSICCAGSAVTWLIKNMGIQETPKDIETLANSVTSCDGVQFFTNFCGIYTPFWEPKAKGFITGLSLSTTKAHIAKACFESIALSTAKCLSLMKKAGVVLKMIRVDGGMCKNESFLQTLADFTNMQIEYSSNTEATVYGIARLASKGLPQILPSMLDNRSRKTFMPRMKPEESERRLKIWEHNIMNHLRSILSSEQTFCLSDYCDNIVETQD